MPHVNLPGSVSLYYEMHTPTCKPDPTKPSLLLLAPSWGNVLQLKDYVAAFKDEYSVCTIEPRSHGRSINPVTATFDFFVAASDIGASQEAHCLRSRSCKLTHCRTHSLRDGSVAAAAVAHLWRRHPELSRCALSMTLAWCASSRPLWALVRAYG